MKNLTLNEMPTGSYIDRTKFNASQSDLTVACAIDFHTAGEKATEAAAEGRYYRIPLTVPPINAARGLYRVLSTKESRVLNLAGNGIHTLSQKGINQGQINVWVHDVLALVHAHLPIKKLVSGGQTGVDIAAAVVGPLLNIPTEINFPKGYKQRPANGIDIIQTKEMIMETILSMQEQLKADLKG